MQELLMGGGEGDSVSCEVDSLIAERMGGLGEEEQ